MLNFGGGRMIRIPSRLCNKIWYFSYYLIFRILEIYPVE